MHDVGGGAEWEQREYPNCVDPQIHREWSRSVTRSILRTDDAATPGPH
jgi:hypothetical protein